MCHLQLPPAEGLLESGDQDTPGRACLVCAQAGQVALVLAAFIAVQPPVWPPAAEQHSLPPSGAPQASPRAHLQLMALERLLFACRCAAWQQWKGGRGLAQGICVQSIDRAAVRHD